MSKRNVLRIQSWAFQVAVGFSLVNLIALLGPSAKADETTNRLASNRLASNRLASNRLASNRLASNRLASNGLIETRLQANSETAEILRAPDGREVYSYMINCALRKGTTIEADIADPLTLHPRTPSIAARAGTAFLPGRLDLRNTGSITASVGKASAGSLRACWRV